MLGKELVHLEHGDLRLPEHLLQLVVGQDDLAAVAWKAQVRLCACDKRLAAAKPLQVVAAVAREMPSR